jgi:3-phosphoshikimate 1-carboxyvinyltransferase
MKNIIEQNSKHLIPIVAPPSKSIGIRAVAIGMLALKYNPDINKFTIKNFPNCDDAIVALNIAKQLGFIVDYIVSNSITLTYKKTENGIITLDCGESALCYRLFSCVAQLFTSNFILSMSETLAKRINNDKNISTDGLRSGKYELDCSNTSQSLTGLLFSLPFVDGNSVIKITNLVSKGYIDLSIELLQRLDIEIIYENDIIQIKGNQRINYDSLWVEGDWSAAANFFVSGAISGDTLISNVISTSKQPDVVILELFKLLKINMLQLSENIFSVNKSEYIGFEFDATNYPDIIPPLVVLAFNAKTLSKIVGINRLIDKESNRRNVLVKVFSMLGGKIRSVGNTFEIQPSKLTGGFVDSHNDHRIAMAIAISAKICKNPITLTGTECINKSFPDFWKYF